MNNFQRKLDEFVETAVGYPSPQMNPVWQLHSKLVNVTAIKSNLDLEIFVIIE